MTDPTLRQLTSIVMICGAIAAASEIQAEPVSNSPEFLLAQNYRAGINPADYLVSEKLDGVRAIWDGKELRFKSGNIIHAPAWFTANFPGHALDGELWIGRQQFDRVSGVTRKLHPVDADWQTITYQVYELPHGLGGFSDRVAVLLALVDKAQVPWLQVVSQFDVATEAQLHGLLDEYVGNGGEGLMLHRRDAVWQTGRSGVLLKLKPILDAEAKVVEYEAGAGKYEGLLGALLVEMPNGHRFRLGTGLSDELRRFPPEIGAIVTYQYRDLTPQGIPKFANFLRVRHDE